MYSFFLVFEFVAGYTGRAKVRGLREAKVRGLREAKMGGRLGSVAFKTICRERAACSL
jgi:hypothetical protein